MDYLVQIRPGQFVHTDIEYPFSMTQGRTRQPKQWEAICDPETGKLPTTVPLDALWVAGDVTVRGGALCFSWATEIAYRKPPSELLERFMELRTEQGIQSFAKGYGPLSLDSDGPNAIPNPQAWNWSKRRESLAAWRRYQQEFNALLSLAAAVRERTKIDRGSFEEFETLGVSVSAPEATIGDMKPRKLRQRWPSILDDWTRWSERDRRAAAARLLTSRTSTFIRWCGVRPVVTLEPRGSSTTTDLLFQDAIADYTKVGLSLFGALTVQLLAAITGAGFAICSACGRAFVPGRRKPAYGRRRYCLSCGRAAAVRDAKADQRTREREKKARLEGRRKR